MSGSLYGQLPNDAELQSLIDACCDDTATEAQWTELNQLLAANREALEFYVAYRHMQAKLSKSARATLQSPPLPLLHEPAKAHARHWLSAAKHSLSHPTALSLLVASLFVTSVLLSLALWTLPQWRAQPDAPAFDRSRIVAEVIRSCDAQWAPESLIDGRLPVDLFLGQPVALLSGTVAIRFDSGAVALLEGPATFVPQGRNRLQLRQGKLAARVPERAIGFLVSTPTVDVIDLGTEFSLQAAATETEVQVLAGSVEVRPRDDGRAPAYLLTAGQAARFGNSSSQGFYVQEKEMNRAVFLGMMAMLATPLPASGALLLSYEFGEAGDTATYTGAAAKLDPTTVNSSLLDGVHNMRITASATAHSLQTRNPAPTISTAPVLTAGGSTTTSLTTAVENDSYIEFSFRVREGETLSLTSFQFDVSRATNTVRGFGFATNLTGYEHSDSYSEIIVRDAASALRPNMTTYTVDLTAPAWDGKFSNLTADDLINFRFYLYGEASNSVLEMDNFLLYGESAQVVPEPASQALLGLGALFLGALTLRRRAAQARQQSARRAQATL